MRGIVTSKLPDPAWGFPTIARVVPTDDDRWGHLRFLVGTDWEPLFPRVPADILDQALRGHATPLMRILGPPPKALVKRLPLAETQCSQRNTCINASPACIPGPKVPDCWESSTFHGPNATIVSYVVHLWREGTPIIVESDP